MNIHYFSIISQCTTFSPLTKHVYYNLLEKRRSHGNELQLYNIILEESFCDVIEIIKRVLCLDWVCRNRYLSAIQFIGDWEFQVFFCFSFDPNQMLVIAI